MNKYRAKALEEKLKNREGLTEKASSQIPQGVVSDKEALIRSCENQEFPLSKGNIDLARKKALEKHMSQDNNSQRLIGSSKNDKDKYYEKYVE
jgi:hypothetical protein